MSAFSLPAPIATGCYDLQRSPFKHAYSTARQPQLRRFTDLCSRSQRSGDACAEVVRCSLGQDHGKPPYQQRQDGALPAQAPGQDFLCQSDAEEVDRAAHAAAAQELVSFPITLDDEVSEAGSDLEADDATLPDQQPAAQTGLKERRHVFSNELAPGDMAAEQEVASSVPAADTSPLCACLHEDSLRSQAGEPADDVPVEMQEPQVAARTVDPVRREEGVGSGASLLPGYTPEVLAVLRRLREQSVLCASEPYARAGLRERSLSLDGVTTAYRYVRKDEGIPARFWDGAPGGVPPSYEYTFRARHADGPPSVYPFELTALSHSDYESKCYRRVPGYQGHLTSMEAELQMERLGFKWQSPPRSIWCSGDKVYCLQDQPKGQNLDLAVQELMRKVPFPGILADQGRHDLARLVMHQLLQAVHNLHSLGYSSLDPDADDVRLSVDKDLHLQLQLHGHFVPTDCNWAMFTGFGVFASPELAASLKDPWKWREASIASKKGRPAELPDFSPAASNLWFAGATLLYMLTGNLPWAVSANFDQWELAHGRQPLELWSVTSSGVRPKAPHELNLRMLRLPQPSHGLSYCQHPGQLDAALVDFQYRAILFKHISAWAQDMEHCTRPIEIRYPAAADLLRQLLNFDPLARPSAAQALQHAWFHQT